jgi:hypothetical protein
MLSWFKRLQSWILKAKFLWLTIIVLIICVWIALFPEVAECRIRLAGLILQMFGIFTVFKGMIDLRKTFNQPSLSSIATRWLRSFPKFRPPKTTMHLTVQSAKHALTASLVRPKHRAGLNATVEDRIRVLESSIDTLELRVDNLQQQIDQVNREGNQGLVTERDIRERDIAELKESLETVETGGVFLSLIGLLWLSIGLIMSTASVEISRLF